MLHRPSSTGRRPSLMSDLTCTPRPSANVAVVRQELLEDLDPGRLRGGHDPGRRDGHHGDESDDEQRQDRWAPGVPGRHGPPLPWDA